MQVTYSNKLADIIKVNRDSVRAKTNICIMELSSLGDLIPRSEAESMRASWRDGCVMVKQLTNSKIIQPWTSVPGFVDTCMEIRHISKQSLPINLEVLIFDDVVAFYRVKPEVCVMMVENKNFSAQQQAIFDKFWRTGERLILADDGSTS